MRRPMSLRLVKQDRLGGWQTEELFSFAGRAAFAAAVSRGLNWAGLG